MKRLAVRCWQSLKWLTSKADGCYGWRVLVESLHQTVVIVSIQDMDQAVPASCGQQLQAWQWQDNLIIYRINSQSTNTLHLRSHNTLTSFWFTVLKTEDLSIMGLHFQNLLHAAQGMNPAEYTVNSHVFRDGGHLSQSSHSVWAFLSYLSIPLRSPDARCLPSGLTQMALMPVLLSAVCPSPGLSAFTFVVHSGSSKALVFPSM